LLAGGTPGKTQSKPPLGMKFNKSVYHAGNPTKQNNGNHNGDLKFRPKYARRSISIDGMRILVNPLSKPKLTKQKDFKQTQDWLYGQHCVDFSLQFLNPTKKRCERLR
jgi:hypothetical protein